MRNASRCCLRQLATDWQQTPPTKKPAYGRLSQVLEKFGRGERIRTSDPLLPKQMRYQAALHPEAGILGEG